MKEYGIDFSKSAVKGLDSLPSAIYESVFEKILALQHEPRPRGCKKLVGDPAYRLRAGDYRILYDIDDGKSKIIILDIDHRSKIYKKR